MSQMRIDVDLGLIPLPVGEAPREAARPEMVDSRQHDVSRLQAVLQRENSPLHQGGSQHQASPMEVLALREAADADLTRRLAVAIGRLWVGNGSASAREVRARLDDADLPDTWVRLTVLSGRLHIELSTPGDDTAHWLATRLDRLAAELGPRLGQPLRLAIRMAGESITLDWPEGTRT